MRNEELTSQCEELKSFLQSSQDRESKLVIQLGENRKKTELMLEELERTKSELSKETDRAKEFQKNYSDLEIRYSAQVKR